MFAFEKSIKTFAGGVSFALSNRFGGVSKKPYESLNLGFNVGDEKHLVEQNLQIAFSAFCALQTKSKPIKSLAYLTQIHSTQGVSISRAISGIANLGEGDFLLTNRKDCALLVLVADCNPVLLYDKCNNALSLIHAGRAGVFGKICARALESMREHFGTHARDVYAFVGVGIRECCYEVGSEVSSYVAQIATDSKHVQKAEAFLTTREGRTYLKLQAMLESEFHELGIVESEFMQGCSCCDKSFFSYRREGTTGRFGLFGRLL
ncbi:polyphenol oxidase family protein [Helicobacter himalayensis]|uniref:polyphenol oxidase family protein n=1 Tax=Helicobacter himalayensis TaxID=1591088 RepID=UPI00082D878E|nr:polyphenol oxidase family protein [Helicobacter himalayensis]